MTSLFLTTRHCHAFSIEPGIYLEGDVTASANEGEYLIRAPRVYYDFTTGRAIMVDAILLDQATPAVTPSVTLTPAP